MRGHAFVNGCHQEAPPMTVVVKFVSVPEVLNRGHGDDVARLADFFVV
jgi:hypothetical protein